jgi:flavin reductase (DIM6/NTAB) family NADH-FMN oxidoreductase RutF
MTTEVFSPAARLVEVDGVTLESGTDLGRALRTSYGAFPSGVVALCADLGGPAPIGMAVSSFTSVSLDPPLLSVCMDNGSSTWPQLRQSPRLGVSVLSTAHRDAARQLASRTGDRFAGLEVDRTHHGAVLLHDAGAWFEVSVHDEVAAGDHVIVLLRVHAHVVRPEVAPLVFQASTFRELV